MKRPRTVWLRVLICTVIVRFNPTAVDPLTRGKMTWWRAFKQSAWSWGYKL